MWKSRSEAAGVPDFPPTDGPYRPDLFPPMETRLDDLDRRVARIEGILRLQAGGDLSDEGSDNFSPDS